MPQSTEFTQLDHREHILKRPDSYVGSVQPINESHWVMADDDPKRFVYKELTYVPAMIRLYLEIVSNAVDNVTESRHQDVPVSTININVTEDTVTVINDGRWIRTGSFSDSDSTPIPTKIFGTLLTSSNYNDDHERWVVGRNGYGAKVVNIFSNAFSVKIYDRTNDVQFTQHWSDHMRVVSKHKISKLPASELNKKNVTGKTQIKYTPDFALFNHYSDHKFTPDDIALFRKYAYDAAASADIKVIFNGETIRIKSIRDYAAMYLHESGAHEPVLFDTKSGRSHIRGAVSVVHSRDTTSPNIIAFVNGMETKLGGTHVNAVMTPLLKELSSALKKRYSDLPSHLLSVSKLAPLVCMVVDARVSKPTFDHQTKQKLTSPSIPAISVSNIVKKLMAQESLAGHVNDIAAASEAKLMRKGDSRSRKKSVNLIDGAEDANWAGTKRSQECTLVISEGHSALTFAVAGIGKEGRDKYGFIPLGGKPLNVTDAQPDKIAKHKPFAALKEMLGLSSRCNYRRDDDFNKLRYGRILILTDADYDGYHIAGLVINYFAKFYPGLLQRTPSVIHFSLTPVIRVHLNKHYHLEQASVSPGFKRGDKNIIDCYSIDDYRQVMTYLQSRNITPSNVEYYKGLGRWDRTDAPEYFDRINWSLKCDSDAFTELDKVFSKGNSKARKKWLLDSPVHISEFRPNDIRVDDSVIRECLEQSVTHSESLIDYSISKFMNTKVIEFSWANNIRSIPHFMDGLKPSQRKVLFACFRRDLTPDKKPIRVAQLGAYTSEHTDYHHGEASLYGTIIGMGQDYVGSNNCPLIDHYGSFGTRRTGGKDAASPRYVNCTLTPMARALFKADDDPFLNFLLGDDGNQIEPEYYMPIIPLILVNGANGLGTGFSTLIPNHDIRDVIDAVREWIEDPTHSVVAEDLVPWYLGFKGKISMTDMGNGKRVKTEGIMQQVSEHTVRITELPVQTWSTDYYNWINNLVQEKQVYSIDTHCSDTDVDFTIKLPKTANVEEFNWKLKSTFTLSNMIAMDWDMMPRKFKSAAEIISLFCPRRLELYKKRYDHNCQEIEWEYMTLRIRAKFIHDIINKLLDLHTLNPETLTDWLTHRYPRYATVTRVIEWVVSLLDIPLRQFNQAGYEAISAKVSRAKDQLESYRNKTAEMLWLDDLDTLQSVYTQWLSHRQ